MSEYPRYAHPVMQTTLQCPVCLTTNLERRSPDDSHTVGDSAAVVVHPDRDEYDSPIGTRGGYVSISLQCDGGHNFDLVIANHKGAETIALVGRDF